MTCPEEKWPYAEVERSIPMLPFEGSTTAATEIMRDRRYLDEIDRQATIFNASFGDAMECALVRNDVSDCWRHLQSALFAAIVTTRILIPPKKGQQPWTGITHAEARRIAKERAYRLRELVKFPHSPLVGSPLHDVIEIRNAMEHIDERLDRIMHSGVQASSSDWYLSDGRLLVRHVDMDLPDPIPLGLRAFVPRMGLLYFSTRRVNLFHLDLDMLTLRHRTAEASEELHERLGRMGSGVGWTYGGLGIGIVPGSESPKRWEALEEWDLERKERLATIPERPRSPGTLYTK